MNLKEIKKEALDIILASNLAEKNGIEVDFSKFSNSKYTLIINKIKKNRANKNSYYINGYMCVSIESENNDNFIFLGKMLSKLNAKSCLSTISFSDSVKIIWNNDGFEQKYYLKCNFKGSLSLESTSDENFLNNLLPYEEKNLETIGREE